MDNDICGNKFALLKIRFEFQLVFYITLACLSRLQYTRYKSIKILGTHFYGCMNRLGGMLKIKERKNNVM